VVVGVAFATVLLLWGTIYYRKQMIANDNKMVPEARLMPMIIASPVFAAGLFIMGWTSDTDIHWIGYVQCSEILQTDSS
jgi:hypothetical protein